MKSQAVESRLTDEKFSGAQDDCIEMTLRNYYVCAKVYSLFSRKISEIFTGVLK